MVSTESQLTLPRQARVLIVEDEIRLADLLTEVIPDMGFSAVAVRSAEDAVRQMESQPFEIIMLDLQLPLMTGMELFAIIRRRWPVTKVIIMTGFGDLDTAQQAIRMDVVDFIIKPFHLNEVEVSLDRARKLLMPGREIAILAQDSLPEAQTLAQAERRAIVAALARHMGNRTAAAAELGISRRKLHYWLNANETE